MLKYNSTSIDCVASVTAFYIMTSYDKDNDNNNHHDNHNDNDRDEHS